VPIPNNYTKHGDIMKQYEVVVEWYPVIADNEMYYYTKLKEIQYEIR